MYRPLLKVARSVRGWVDVNIIALAGNGESRAYLETKRFGI